MRRSGWMELRGARANNLRGETIRFPLGVLVGVCGVSGSGKSTLVIDTLGRALAPQKQTTSVAREPLDPGEHDAIEGAPGRVLLVDQARAGLESPAAFLGLDQPLRALFAASEEAEALGLGEDAFARGCSACGGRGRCRHRDGIPAGGVHAVRSLPRHRAAPGSLGGAPARPGAARSGRPDHRPGGWSASAMNPRWPRPCRPRARWGWVTWCCTSPGTPCPAARPSG